MNRLAVRTLLAFLAALTILVGIMAGASALGLRRSVVQWDRARQAQVEALAIDILQRRPAAEAVQVPFNIPLAVYDDAGTLVFTNRPEWGSGRGSGTGARTPLSAGGRVVGSYRAGDMRFRASAVNETFLRSLRWTLGLGLAVAFALSVPFALVFSRSLSSPAVHLAAGLDRIARGEAGVDVPERGAEEMARIARSANRLARQLEREQDLRRQWIADVAHDLRTPVAALKAQFEGMRDGVLDPGPARIERNIGEIGRIESLVADLEELMRLESPELRPQKARIDAAAFLEDLRERFAAAAGQRGIALAVRGDAGSFSADPHLLHRAFTNLVANALRHCPDGGTIEISAGAAGPTAELAVFNTGGHVPAEDLPRVFDRLFRGERARSTPGSGLGLTIARRIAEVHGGTIDIANVEKGVRVRIRLPRAPGPHALTSLDVAGSGT